MARSPIVPFRGLKVYEFGCNIAGPYAAWILAELGADVVKVERPEGDDARDWGPPFWHGSSSVFHAVNRKKKSVVVDFNDPVALERLKSRIRSDADVVIQNLRAGVMEKFGLSAAVFRADNARLIYCNLHAFGATGPMKDQPGYDALLQAFGGLVSVTGEDKDHPVRSGVSLIDMGTAMWGVIGILSALHRRDMTGEGGLVDASLFETALGWMTWHATSYQASGALPEPQGTGARGVVPYEAYECTDGKLLVAGSNDRLFAKFAEVLGHPEWTEDERFRSNPKRVENRPALNALIQPLMATKSMAEWRAKLDAVRVPNSPIQTIDLVLAHPQTAALDMAQATHDPAMRLIALSMSLDGWRPSIGKLSPVLGADTIEVLERNGAQSNGTARDVIVREEGLRDGLQNIGTFFPTAQKKAWISAAAAAGIPELQVCSFVRDDVMPQFRDADDVAAYARSLDGLRVSALVGNVKGAERAFAAGVDTIGYVISVSESHNQRNMNRSVAESKAECLRVLAMREEFPSVNVSGGVSTAFGCGIEGSIDERTVLGLVEWYLEAGIDEIVVSDTVGYANPAQVRRLFSRVLGLAGEKRVVAHFHNTRGMGLANACAALDAGVRDFDGCTGGLGGCPTAPGATGNVVLEDLVFMFESMGLRTGIDLEKLTEIRALISAALPDVALHGHYAVAGAPKGFVAAPV